MLTETELKQIEQEAESEYSCDQIAQWYNEALQKAYTSAAIKYTERERERAKGLEDTLAHIMTRPGDWDEVKQLARRALANYRHPKVDKPVKTSD